MSKPAFRMINPRRVGVDNAVVRVAQRLKLKSLGFESCTKNSKARVHITHPGTTQHDKLGEGIARSVLRNVRSVKRVSVSIKTPKYEKRYKLERPCACPHKKAAARKRAKRS